MSGPLDYESKHNPHEDDITAPIKCPKCQSRMEMGAIASATGPGIGANPAQYFYTGKFKKGLLGYSFTSRGEYPLVPSRCIRCGYVELYAPNT